jgi:hypothetical protein
MQKNMIRTINKKEKMRCWVSFFDTEGYADFNVFEVDEVTYKNLVMLAKTGRDITSPIHKKAKGKEVYFNETGMWKKL